MCLSPVFYIIKFHNTVTAPVLKESSISIVLDTNGASSLGRNFLRVFLYIVFKFLL